MSNDFTPGPWTCDPGEPADYSVGPDGSPPGIYATRPNAEGPDDDPILLFVPREPVYTVGSCFNVDPDDLSPDTYDALYHGDMSANMMLAAAAPELLTALESVVEGCELRCGEIGWNHDPDMLIRARSVIAKARGEA